jgi:uncharacterized protein YlaI
MELIMKKLLYLICLLSFGQIFSADNGQPPAKRQRVGQHKQSFDFSKWRMHDDDIVKSCKTCGKIFPDPNDEEAIEGHERFCNPNKKPRARRKKYSLPNTDLSSNFPLSDDEKELATALLMLGSDLGKRPDPDNEGEQAAKRQQVAPADSAQSNDNDDKEPQASKAKYTRINRKFKCEICKKIFADDSAFSHHYRASHTSEGIKAATCQHCGMRFARVYFKDRHLQEGRCKKQPLNNSLNKRPAPDNEGEPAAKQQKGNESTTASGYEITKGGPSGVNLFRQNPFQPNIFLGGRSNSDLASGATPFSSQNKSSEKPQQGSSGYSFQSIEKLEDSESSQGEDEEFLCQYCGQDLNSQRALDSHEQRCSQRSSSLQAQQNIQEQGENLSNTQQEFKRWQNLSAQQQQLQQWQLQQWQLQQRLQQQLFAQQQQQLQQQQLQQKLQQQLQQQKQSEEQEKDSALSVSSSEGQDQELYQKHLVENPDKTFGCKACEKQYKTKYAARVHIKGKHGKKDLTDDNFCDLCGKTLGSRDSYNRHMKGHTNQEPTCCFQNRGCTYSGRRDNLKRHELKCVFKDKKLNQQQLVPIFTPEQLQNLLRQAQQSLQPQQGISAEQQPQAAVSSDDDDDDDDEDDDSDENEV